MSSALIDSVRTFLCRPSRGYTYANKKDEDDEKGLQLFQIWEENFPISKKYRDYGYNDENAFVKELVEGLRSVPITHETLDRIQTHMQEVAKQSNSVRDAILDSLKEGKATFLSDNDRFLIRRSVCLVVPQRLW